MQIPILNGIYTDEGSDFRTSYPRNLIPVPKATGISAGYLRPAEGIVKFGSGPGLDRGGINWNGNHFRVMGTKLVQFNNLGAYSVLGDVGGSGQVTLDYSFDRLAIASSGSLYYWDNSVLTQVTDPDLGVCLDVIWVDGYFMSTDGQYLIVTELTDPTIVNPLKYGSSETDPDPIVGLIKLRNEVYALNRYTIEVFNNVGGDFFPFQRIEGAQMMRGAIGTNCAAMFMEQIAFMGGGRNESVSIWIGSNGQTSKLSTREIEQILSGYSESDLSNSVMEVRVIDSHQLLYIHLTDRTLVFDGAASRDTGQLVWFTLDSGITTPAKYKARNFVRVHDKWICGDPSGSRIGYLDSGLSSHYGSVIGWEFGTQIIYNGSKGAIFHELELVCLTGRVELGADPVIWTSYSTDGENWSMEKSRTAGKRGQRNKRINWLSQGYMKNWRVQKFRGTSDSHMSMARLEANLEPLYA